MSAAQRLALLASWPGLSRSDGERWVRALADETAARAQVWVDTADIGATLYALGQAAGQGLVPSEVARLAVHVEPTDSSLFPGLALWDHRYGHVYEDLGAPPALTVIILDPGGVVDTLAFNQLDYRQVLGRLAPQHREAPLPRACGSATWEPLALRRR